MKEPSKTRRAVQSGDVPLAPASRSPLGPLGRLLSRIGAAGALGFHADRRPISWEDEEFVYIEAVLPGLSEDVVDISVNDGKVFIRVGKSARSPRRAVRPGPTPASPRRGATPGPPEKPPGEVPDP